MSNGNNNSHPNSTNICYSNNNIKNIRTFNNKHLTYICEKNNSQIGISDPSSLASPSAKKDWSIADYYEDAARKMSQADKLFHIDICLSGRTGKYDNRRSLNIDIMLEPNTKPFKYICKMAPYTQKHGVFQNIPTATQNWPGWQLTKELYAEHKTDAMFGKFTNRTRNTKTLPRVNVPCCVGGIVEQGNKTMAHLMIFDMYFKVQLLDISTKNGDAYKFFTKRGSITTQWEEPSEYTDEQIADMLGDKYV